MAPPYRFEPPPFPGALARARVHRLLRGRWEQRATTVTAGAGMGKTTALAMAVAEDRLEERGLDVWLTCLPGDADAEHFSDGLAGALAHQGLPVGTEAGLRAVVGAVAVAAPRPVCLVLDDVQVLPADSPGAALLGDLVVGLPQHAHVVLLARSAPPVGLTRLEARGEVLRVTGADLRLTAAEVAELNGTDDGSVGAADGFAGWPALVALAGTGDGQGPRRFVEEEVLSGLTPAQVRVLALCSVVRGATAALLHDAVGASRQDIDAVADLPLVRWDGDHLTPDPLWRGFTRGLVEPAERQQVQRRCAEDALAVGDLDRALSLGLDARDDDLVRAVLAAATAPDRPVDAAACEAALAALPEPLRRSPEGQLLQGLVVAARDPGATTSRDAYRRAAEAYRALGDIEGEARALAQMGYLAHVHRDAAAMEPVLARLGELREAGSHLAAATTTLGTALLALSSGESQTALHVARSLTADDLPVPWDVVTHWVEATACINLGLDARPAARRLAQRQRFPLPGMQDRGYLADLRAGDVEALLEVDCPGLGVGNTDRDRHLAALVTAGVRAITGRTDEAARLVAIAERLATSHTVPAAVANRAVVLAALADAVHDDERVAEILREGLAAVPLDGPHQASWYPAMNLCWRHLPETVAHWEALDLQGSLAVDRDLARAVAALDAGGPTAGVHALEWPRPGEAVRAVGLRGATVLAAAALAEERSEGDALARWLLEQLGAPARAELRRLADDDRLGSAVGRLLGAVAVRPDGVRRLTLLGPPELHIADVRVGAADWRRQRVQALLAHLVVNGRGSRDALVDALWPEATLTAGRRSLRSTMNYLLGVLEPERVAGEASWFVRSDGDHVELIADDLLEADVTRLERAVAAAARAERDGVFSAARDEHDRVVELWRGPLLEGHPEEGWVAAERRRLARLVVAAALRAGELHLAAGEVGRALELGSRALEVDPYCQPAHRLVVRLHLDTGNRAAARAAMGRCRDVLADLGVRPDPSTAELARRVTQRAAPG